jgi:hypothetical protein
MPTVIGHRTDEVNGADASCTNWSAWGPSVKVRDNPPLFQQCRWMDCQEDWWTQDFNIMRGDPGCPLGYTWDGADCVWDGSVADQGDKPTRRGPSSPPGAYTWDEPAGDPVQHFKTWSVPECRYWSLWGDIKHASLKRRGRPLDPMEAVFSKGIPPNTKFEIRELPRNSSILVNGERVRGRTLDTSRLPIGLSVIGIVANDAQTDVPVTFGLNVVSPLEIVVREPVINIDTTDRYEPVGFSVQVRNRSEADELVRLTVRSPSSGWRAHVVGEPIRLLGPKKSTRVGVDARRWSFGGRKSSALLPFSVEVTSLRGKHSAAATVYVEPS